MKRSIILAMMAFASFFVHAQSYGDLWKQVKKAASNDLPKTQVEVLDKIVEKASAELNYGQLLAAQLQRCGVQGSIAPDSLGVALDRLKQAAETAERSNPVLAAVYAACLRQPRKEDSPSSSATTRHLLMSLPWLPSWLFPSWEKARP